MADFREKFSVCLGKQSHAHTHQYLLRLALPGPREKSLDSISVVYQINCAGQEVMPRKPHSFYRKDHPLSKLHHCFLHCVSIFNSWSHSNIIYFFAVFYWVFLVDILFHLSHLEFFFSIFRLVPNISLIYIFRYGTLVICFLISPTSENAFPPLLHMNYLCQIHSTGVTIILAAMLHCLLKLKSFKGEVWLSVMGTFCLEKEPSTYPNTDRVH